jgi:hypothetical protein
MFTGILPKNMMMLKLHLPRIFRGILSKNMITIKLHLPRILRGILPKNMIILKPEFSEDLQRNTAQKHDHA